METTKRKRGTAHTQQSFVKQANEWWCRTDFNEMATITGIRQHEFSYENGYQEFVDACNNYWDSLSDEEKISKWRVFQ